MKGSVFNIVERHHDMILLFNSLSGKYAAIPWNGQLFQKLDQAKQLNEKECIYMQPLMDYGFFVTDLVNEMALAEMKKMDFIYSNILKLEIIPTLACNFDCPYCYERHSTEKMSADIVKNILCFITKQINDYAGIQIFWFGGEPLLTKDIVIEVSSYVKKLAAQCKKKFYFSITTNGYLLNEEVFEQLYRAGVRKYQVTFDGMQEQHDIKRHLKDGRGTFQQIYNNLIMIKQKRGLFHFDLRCNITRDNFRDIYPYINLVTNDFGDDKRFNVYFRPVGDWGGRRVKSIVSSLMNGNTDIEDSLLSNQIIDKSKINFNLQFLWSGKINLCESIQKNYYVINPYGELLKCTKMLDNPMNKIGIIDENGIPHLNQEVLSYWIGRSLRAKEQCANCKSYANCFGIQCPISDMKDCQYTQDQVKKFLVNQYQSNSNKFLKINKEL